VDVTGRTSHVVSPTQTTSYTLTASNGQGTASAAVTVTVAPFQPVVNPDLEPVETFLPGADGPRPVGASRDQAGVQTDFVIGEVLVRPESPAALQAFLNRYGAEIVGSNEIPEPPASLGITLMAQERQATEYLVRFDPATIDSGGLQEDAASVGLAGLLELSSPAAVQTLIGITDAAAAGFDVSPNFLQHPDQASPSVLFGSSERGGADAFARPYFQTTGSRSNVVTAWQFIAAHGIQRRVRVAIIDGGFWLDANGSPQTAPGDGSDLPANPIQYDFVNDDGIAEGVNPAPCSGGGVCRWHGNGSAGVATGLLGLGGGVINAYNLDIDIAADPLVPDAYEGNDSPATARNLVTRFTGPSGFAYELLDPRIAIDASIHSQADVDYYIVRAARPNLREQVMLNAYPAVRIYGNDSPI